jgi:hypothetical protein
LCRRNIDLFDTTSKDELDHEHKNTWFLAFFCNIIRTLTFDCTFIYPNNTSFPLAFGALMSAILIPVISYCRSLSFTHLHLWNHSRVAHIQSTLIISGCARYAIIEKGISPRKKKVNLKMEMKCSGKMSTPQFFLFSSVTHLQKKKKSIHHHSKTIYVLHVTHRHIILYPLVFSLTLIVSFFLWQ